MDKVNYRLEGIDLVGMRQDRLARLRSVLRDADVAGILLFDPINIRYASDVSNMQVWCMHNPVRYLFGLQHDLVRREAFGPTGPLRRYVLEERVAAVL